MFILNRHPDHRRALDPVDAETLGVAASERVEHFLSFREDHAETPLRALPALAAELGVGTLHVKDEAFRLGLGSFKALGGAYAVIQLVLEEAERRLGRSVGFDEFRSDAVRAIAATITVACATDGNHGRSVAQGAALVGAKTAIFVHSGVSDVRVVAIERFGAKVSRVEGTYDDAVAYVSTVAAERAWMIVSDTSWPGYERIPGLVMQGYTAVAREALRKLPAPPTHIFLQAGVGGFAAAIAGHLAVVLGEDRPVVIVVDPARAACMVESARAGRLVKIAHGQATVMAMLECYEPSLVAWRILTRLAEAFMTVDEGDAIAAMNRLARPAQGEFAIVAGESGAVGLAGLMVAMGDAEAQLALGLGADSRVLLINTEGATDPALFEKLVGLTPEFVRGNTVEILA